MKKVSSILGFCFALVILGAPMLSLSAWAAEGSPAKSGGGGEGGEGAKSKKPPPDISGGRFAGDPIFVHMPPMVLPVITEDGAEQLVTLEVDIQAMDFDSADNMHTNMPRLVDAVMRALYGGLGSGDLRNGKLVNVAKVKAKATAAIDSIVGAAAVKDVLIQGVSQRML